MSIIIKPEIRKTSEIKHHYNNAPGERYVFIDKKLFPESEFYIMGRRVEFVPKEQRDYVDEHRHNCNSYYLFIGDEENLSGLKAEVVVENNKRVIESPCSVLIPERILHTYKLIEGKGWFIHVVLSPDYDLSLFDGKIEKIKINTQQLIKKAIRQDKKPKEGERPLSSNLNRIANPQRYIFINPEIYDKPKIYSAIHQILSDKPYDYQMRLHYHATDEVYLVFNKPGQELEISIFDGQKRGKIKSPATIYHPANSNHKYEYTNGGGFILVVLKEKIAGEGYKFIPVGGN